jgi:hypothetical protein
LFGYAERIEAARPHWIPAAVLQRELVERGYGGGLTQLKAFLWPTPAGRPLQTDCSRCRRRIELALSTRSCRSPFSDRMTGPHRSPVIRSLRDERRVTKNAVIGVRASRRDD